MMNTLLHFHLTKTVAVCVAILSCVSITSLLAQTNRIDSLKQKLASTPELESFEINFQLAREFASIDNKIALELVRKAKTLAYQKRDSLDIVRSLRLTGQVYRRLDNLDSSIHYLLKGLPIAHRLKFDKERNAIHNSLGLAYTLISKFDRALYYLLQSAALYEKSGDKSMSGVVENNIGLVYYRLDDFKMALEHYNKSLSIKLSIKDHFDMDVLLINISLCYAYLGDLAEARKTLNTVLEKYPENSEDNNFGMAMHASGLIWYKSDNITKAEKDFRKSYMITKKNNDQRYIFENINGLSEIYLMQGKLALAEIFLIEGEKMSNTSNFDAEEMILYKRFCSLYMAKRNYKKLSFYQEKYIQMRDSVSNESQTNNLMRLHAEASEKENKAQLTSQEQTLQLKDEIINKQFGINVLIGFAIALLAIFIYVLVKIFHQRKEANYLLNIKVIERSDELSSNYENLKLALEQRDTTLAQLNKDLNNSIESMRTLCTAGVKVEIDKNALQYFNEISATTSSLSKSLHNILSKAKRDY
ncbi:MAG: tetratricopeptide repeat protein [Chryseolinea sp.]